MGLLQRKVESAASSFARVDLLISEQTITSVESILHSITLSGDGFLGTLVVSNGAAATPANILTEIEIPAGESETFIFNTKMSNGIRVTPGTSISYTGNGTTDLDFLITANTITRVGGSFITDGFLVGQEIAVTGSASNDATLTINDVATLVLTVDEDLVTETNVAATLSASTTDCVIIYN